MITDRQADILKAIVREYTITALPVGSKRIVELTGNSFSSATIRNECAVLEKEGFLEKTHTSSGRIPSSQGYRYYVDNLMEKRNMFDDKIFAALDELFCQRNKSIDEIVSESSKIISEMTGLTAVVSIKDNFEDLKLRRIESIKLSNNSVVVIFVLSNGEIVKKVYYLKPHQIDDLKIAIDLFNTKLANTSLESLNGKSNEVSGELKSVLKDADLLFQNFVSTAVKQTRVKNDTYGIKNMLENPEFNDTEKLKQVLKIVDMISPFEWFDYNHKNSESSSFITTKIGNEIGTYDGSEDLAIVCSEFTFGNGQQNAITLVGPKRMKYDEANLLLHFLIDKITKLTGN